MATSIKHNSRPTRNPMNHTVLGVGTVAATDFSQTGAVLVNSATQPQSNLLTKHQSNKRDDTDIELHSTGTRDDPNNE
ncbi:hypothetical protein BGX20_011447 [Mortierella sp. AD010]|nr:hypothetical protein BGX20_011447 [Mortierella sp. AD010]